MLSLPRLAPAALAFLCLLLPTAASAQTSPAFAQLEGSAGCLIAEASFDPDLDERKCGTVPALNLPTGVAVTPDGAQVVVTTRNSTSVSSPGSNSVSVFNRDPQTGGVSFASCVSDDGGDGRPGSEGICTDGDALAGAGGVAFSPDGAFAYVTATTSNAITWLSRDKTNGKLAPAGCIKHSVRPGEHCGFGTVLDGANAVAVAADGRHVYVSAARSSAVTVFRRDVETGALTQQSCVSASGTDGACTRAPGLFQPGSLAVSADGAHVYVLGVGALATLAVDPTTGDLSPKACMTAVAPKGGTCTENALLSFPHSATLSSDGRNLVVLAGQSLISFSRDAATGGLARQQCFTVPEEEEEDFDEEDTDDEEEEEEDDPEAEDAQADGCDPAEWESATSITMSADGRGLFITGFGDVAAYQRDPDSGRLTMIGCLEQGDTNDKCAERAESGYSLALAASPDARNLYIITQDDELLALQTSVAITSQALRARADGTVRVGLACPAARREGCAGRLTGAARAARFRLAAGHRTMVRVPLSKRQRKILRRHRRATFAISARMPHVTATTKRVKVSARR